MRRYLQGNSIPDIGNTSYFEYLPHLRRLYLNLNAITYISPNAFENISNVETILLHYNSISSIDANVFSNLTNLKYLWINSNSITYIDPYAFYNLHSLVELFLDHNSISSIPNGVFSSLTSLQTLKLSNNNYSIPTCCSFCGLPTSTTIEMTSSYDTLQCGKNQWLLQCNQSFHNCIDSSDGPPTTTTQ